MDGNLSRQGIDGEALRFARSDKPPNAPRSRFQLPFEFDEYSRHYRDRVEYSL
jgi:hypothetical protein